MKAGNRSLQILGLTLIVFSLMGCSTAQTASIPTVSPTSLTESIANQYVSAFETRDIEKYASLHSDDALYVDNGVTSGKTAVVKVYIQELQALFRYVDSFQVKLVTAFVSDDGRFAVFRGSYTDWGNIGLPATVPLIVVAEIRDGKIIKETAYYDGSPFKK